ncbi:MAG: hypothetical protein ACTH7Q_00765 [Pseudoalteromonas sp.]
MKTFQILKVLNASLGKEDEYSLSYLHGIKLDSFKHVKQSKTKYSGLFLQVCLYLYSLLKTVRFSKRNLDPNKEVLMFAGTKNQYDSLNSTMNSLDGLSVDYNLIATKAVGRGAENHSLNVLEFLLSAYAFVRYSYKLYFRLKKTDRKFEIKYFFSIYCQTYTNLVFFISILLKLKSKNKLKLVVLSNDHNNENRCLRLACEVLNIKTLYMQHASVSTLFPPLQYDYALLDGKVAYDIYQNCLRKLPNASIYPVNVFLSGQKKSISNQGDRAEKIFDIGVAVNTLDEFEILEELVKKANKYGLSVLVRTHPGQQKGFLDKFALITVTNNIEWCAPHKDSLSYFFNSIDCLIAANSSIHLEAALANTATLYYEFNNNIALPDYYGYVKNGLAYRLNIENMLESINKGKQHCNSIYHNEAVQKYSATYMTKWEHKEGELAAKLIKRILIGKSFDDIFIQSTVADTYALYNIK